jgi:hypothetical protein
LDNFNNGACNGNNGSFKCPGNDPIKQFSTLAELHDKIAHPIVVSSMELTNPNRNFVLKPSLRYLLSLENVFPMLSKHQQENEEIMIETGVEPDIILGRVQRKLGGLSIDNQGASSSINNEEFKPRAT